MNLRCWLCEFSDDDECTKIHRLITAKAGVMGVDQLAGVVHEILSRHVPDAQGIGLDDVKAHITNHLLSSSVRVAGILRSLLDLTDRLQGILMTVDEDGNIVVDAKNVAVYLKVVSETMQMYKTGDPCKLMFSDPGR
jgi:hypothetical protein